MREEVLRQTEVERKEALAGSASILPSHRPGEEPGSAATADGSATTASGFRFAALGQELVVAGVFVRVYNEQPNFPVSDPAAFCKGLVTFLHARMKPEVSLSNAACLSLHCLSLHCLSVFLCDAVCLPFAVCLPGCLLAGQSVCPPICLSVCLFVYLSVLRLSM